MYRSSLVTGLAVAFAVMGSVLAAVGVGTGNWLALAPATLFGATAYFMWYHASGRLADRVYRSVEGAASGSQEGPRGRGSTTGRRATADGRGVGRPGGRGGFGAGPRDAWEHPGGQSRERVQRERARRQRAREHAKRVGGRKRGAASAQQAVGMSAREAASVLGVQPDAEPDAIRTAYRERVKEVHPDTDGGDEEQFKLVRDAYEVLSES